MAEDHGLYAFAVAKDVGSNNQGDLSRNLGARGMPLTSSYDSDGRLVDTALGALVGGALQERMRLLGFTA